jgi:hypothetical protein
MSYIETLQQHDRQLSRVQCAAEVALELMPITINHGMAAPHMVGVAEDIASVIARLRAARGELVITIEEMSRAAA